jgi:hypothetical protein
MAIFISLAPLECSGKELAVKKVCFWYFILDLTYRFSFNIIYVVINDLSVILQKF